MRYARTLPALAGVALVTAGMAGWLPVNRLRAQTRVPEPQRARAAAQTPADFRPVLDRYCVGCHSARMKAGNLVLDATSADLQTVAASPDLWERVVWKLRSASMPPIGMP